MILDNIITSALLWTCCIRILYILNIINFALYIADISHKCTENFILFPRSRICGVDRNILFSISISLEVERVAFSSFVRAYESRRVCSMNQRSIERDTSNIYIYIYIFYSSRNTRARFSKRVIFREEWRDCDEKSQRNYSNSFPPQQVSIRFTRGIDLSSLSKFPPGDGRGVERTFFHARRLKNRNKSSHKNRSIKGLPRFTYVYYIRGNWFILVFEMSIGRYRGNWKIETEKRKTRV